MPTLQALLRSMLCVGFALAALGCGGGSSPPPNRPKTVKVTGKVTYKGAAVDGATITFTPASGEGNGAGGRTDANGEYTLTTFAPQDGAIPGSYQVTISKSVVVGADPSYGDVNSPNYGKDPPPEARGKLEHQVPQKYNSVASSMLSATVSEGGDNTFNFDLTD